jgi:hypothetical protein
VQLVLSSRRLDACGCWNWSNDEQQGKVIECRNASETSYNFAAREAGSR